jgi:crotonobetainyl-CoA:carnitine CoA-transferase CaiB-like acyl-CoA transferase
MGISLSDHLAGIFACYGVLAALFARERTGRGQLVETSLLESSVAFLAENAANFFEGSGKPPSRATRTHQAQVFTFVAADEKPFVVHLSSPPKFWQGLLKATESPHLGTDERFAKRPARVSNYDALNAELKAVFRTKERAVWLERLRTNDVPCGPLNDFKEVFSDPQVERLGLKLTLPHAKRGTVTVVGSPVRLSDTPVTITTSAPELGADTERYLGKRSNA